MDLYYLLMETSEFKNLELELYWVGNQVIADFDIRW